MRSFLFLSVLVLLIVAYAAIKNNLQKKSLVPKVSFEIKSAVSPKVGDVTEYIDLNINVRAQLCAIKNVYNRVPVYIKPSENINLVSVVPSLSCKLIVNNDGHFEYYINLVMVWTSKYPRRIIKSTDLRVLEHYMLENKNWQVVHDSGKFLLHVAPFAITSKVDKKIVWTFMSGWALHDRTIPNEKFDGIATSFMTSENKKYFAAILSNGDIVTINESSNVQESIIQNFCL